MKIAFCDDDAACREEIDGLLSIYAGARPDYNISYNAFAYTDDILDASAKIGGFDLYVLDIVMQNDITGIELGIKLRQAGYDGKIVYLTSSAEYAIDSFKVKAFNYIMKPIEKESFFAALDEVCEVTDRSDKSIIVKTKENSVKVHFDTILYAELQKRSIVYYLVGGNTVESTTIRTTFSEAVSDLLDDHRFVSCGASMIANLSHVTMVENEAIIFRNKHKAYLGKKACRELRGVWNDYHFTQRSKH